MKSNRRIRAILDQSRFAAYSAAGTVAWLGAGMQANAEITHVVLNEQVSDPTDNGVAITSSDLLFGTFHFTLQHSLIAPGDGWAFGTPENQGTPGVEVSGFSLTGYNYINNIAYNTDISTLTQFLAPSDLGSMGYINGYPNNQFLNPGIAFIGVRFNTNQYGWVRLDMGGAPLNDFEVLDYAYAGAGEAILAGQVPEPGSLASLALGAAGLLSWRHRRQDARR